MFIKRYIGTILVSLFPVFSAHASAIKIGIIAGPSVQVMEVATKIAKEKYHLDLEPVVFTDYMIPNEALNNGDIDANLFQTVSFLNQSVSKRGYKLTSIGNTFIYPMGVYSHKIQNLNELKEKSIIAIPNDASNQGRALSLLAHAGLIELKPNAGEFANFYDIVKNKKNLKIITLDSNQLPRVVPDVDAVVLNNDFVTRAGFSPKQSLVQEDPKKAQLYVNIIVVKSSEKNKKEWKEIIDVLHSKEVVKKNLELYPGAEKTW